MKKQSISILATLLALVMILGAFASCGSKQSETPTTTTTAKTESESVETGAESTGSATTETTTESGNTSETTASTESGSSTEVSTETTTESGSEGNAETSDVTEAGTAQEVETNKHTEIIELADQYKNGVNTVFTDTSQSQALVSNLNMNLLYNTKASSNNMQIAYLNSPSGNTYIENTMDIILNMKNGKSYAASKSTNNAVLNIYRYGYYYYETRIEGQSFKNSIIVESAYDIDTSPYSGAGLAKNSVKGPNKSDDGTYVSYQRIGEDPWVRLDSGVHNAADFDFFEVTLRTPEDCGTVEIFLIAGNATTFTESQVFRFDPINDGEFHTYFVPFDEIDGYSGELKAIRLDVNVPLKASFDVMSARLIKANYNEAPEAVSIQRSFVTYSDKLHQVIQFSATDTVADVENVQIVTKIAADTVDKFIVVDKKGPHEDLDEVIWRVVESCAFDIKGTGIFGYILPAGESGTLMVTLEDGYYVITQTLAVEQFIPSVEGSRNGNDVFMGNRIYTDETHTFDKFIYEAACERNPLEADRNIVVNTSYDSATFKGYDPLYGYYKFTVKGTGFTAAYHTSPNKQYRVNFTVKGDKYDRTMYFMTYTVNGSLECAVMLDGDDMLLPVPLQVSKNFAGDGENTIYNLDDASYGEVFFPMTLKANASAEYTVLNLYQNWGKVPLKQISSIQFHTPYYHLSTGVTETNCIVQLAIGGPGLPDHRAMSAPFWPTQPQHNSGGGHQFMGGSSNTSVMIDSYGPTYCDIVLGYQALDGKIQATYTHTEFPQLDENRAFYEFVYTFTEDVTFDNFSKQFRFYQVTDNNANNDNVYKYLGYLDENNRSQHVENNLSKTVNEYVLGDECPYFTMFYMPTYLDSGYGKTNFGYCNVSYLIYNCEITVDGQPYEAQFLIKNTENRVVLTLNIKEEITFKAGDTIKLNSIIMPWGSQDMNPPENEADRDPNAFYYDTVIDEATGELYMDKNVRDVRENTLLNPLHAIAVENAEIIESVYVPKIKSTDGKTATFTLKGGNDNVAFRVYGFKKLTAPVLEELVDGNWTVVDISSYSTPDQYNNGYYYDGYMVHYDGDGTYSYSFVAYMDNGAERTFRVSAAEDFAGWPGEVPPDVEEEYAEDPINVYVDAKEIYKMTQGFGSISSASLSDDESYVRLFANKNASDVYLTFYNANSDRYKDLETTGKYAIIKYRLPATSSHKLRYWQIWTSNQSEGPLGGESISYGNLVHDGEWHVIVFDMTKNWSKFVKADDNGNIKTNFFRIDFFDYTGIPNDFYIDFAYVGLCETMEQVCEINSDMKTVTMVGGDFSENEIDTSTGAAPEIIVISPESEMQKSEVPYAGWIDYVNSKTFSAKGTAYNKEYLILDYNDTTLTSSLAIRGWAVAEGGFSKYVWSVDGKTWHDVNVGAVETLNATDAVPYYDAVTSISKYVIQDTTASGAKVRFQTTTGIGADLSDYVGQTVNVTFAAIPNAEPNSLCVLAYVRNVTVGAEVVTPPSEEGYEVLLDADHFAGLKMTGVPAGAVTVTKKTDDGEYARFARTGTKFGDGYIVYYSNQACDNTGNYMIIKYRTDHMTDGELWANTGTGADAGGQAGFNQKFEADGKWHILVLDLSLKLSSHVTRNADGRYTIQWARFDIFNTSASEGYFDIAYILFCDDLNDAYEVVGEANAAYCNHYEGDKFKQNDDGTHTATCALCGTEMESSAHVASSGMSFDSELCLYKGTCACGVELTQEFLYVTEAFEDPIPHNMALNKMVEDGESFTRYTVTTNSDPYAYIYKEGSAVTGQYMMIKYRLYNGGKDSALTTCYFASTASTNGQATGNGDGSYNMGTFKDTNGEWAYIVIDLTSVNNSHFRSASNGSYSLKYFRLRYQTEIVQAAEGGNPAVYTTLDIAYIAFADDLSAFEKYTTPDTPAEE